MVSNAPLPGAWTTPSAAGKQFPALRTPDATRGGLLPIPHPHTPPSSQPHLTSSPLDDTGGTTLLLPNDQQTRTNQELWEGKAITPPLPSLVQDQSPMQLPLHPSPLGPPSSSRVRVSLERGTPDEPWQRSTESPSGSTQPQESYSTRMKRTGGVINSQSSVHTRPPQHGGRGSQGNGQHSSGGGAASRPAPTPHELELMGAYRHAYSAARQSGGHGVRDGSWRSQAEPVVASQVECQPTCLRAMLDGFEEWTAAMEGASTARRRIE
jgi:hypothetical protein